MKKKTILSTFALAIFFIGYNQLTSNPTGAPAGYSGSPADGQNCANCHGGSAVAATNVLTSNVPVAGYVPGTNYTITVSVSGSTARKGFQVSPQNNAGVLMGTLTAGTGNKIVNSKYITHTAAKTTNPGAWTFTWTAPVAGSGAVSFYGAFVNGYSNISTQVLTVNEQTSTTTSPTVSSTTIASVSNTSVNLSANINANGKTYNASFCYKDSAANTWTLVMASPTTVSGSNATNISYSLNNLNAGTTYKFKACAWNAGDSTFGAINTFTTTKNPVSVTEANALSINSVYPNPAADYLNVGFNLQQKSTVEISIISLDGKVNKQLLNNELNAGYQNVKVNTTDLKAGVYMLLLNANNITVSKKIMIQ
ncbi:MAG: choice-of-anchor V domain-containing protein [Candidatus Methylacidiphilales bacterium]